MSPSSPTLTSPSSVEDKKNQITSTELSECDREELHHIGQIQGGQTGHAIFFSNNSASTDGCLTIYAADQDILSVDFINHEQE